MHQSNSAPAGVTEVKPVSPQAQMLLTALRNMIIPLVQTTIDTPNPKDVLHDIAIGPEAEDFLAALQKYISYIICVEDRSQPDSQEGITRRVDLEDISTGKLPPMNSMDREGDTLCLEEKVGKEHDVITSSVTSPSRRKRLIKDKSVIPRNLDHTVTRSQHSQSHSESALLDRALTALRARVFNEMPIRLLCFTKHQSKLDITLLDRAGIYSYLSSKLKVTFETQRLELKTAPVAWDVVSGWISDLATYAILSHTWLRSAPGEVTFEDWNNKGNFKFNLTHPGYAKLVNFCSIAISDHSLTLGWMDTICIDKSSSSELDESIRSMYKWYQKAKTCITYLAETATLAEIARDPWFTRGWTLQELFAPKHVKFYSTTWIPLTAGSGNDKKDPTIQIHIEAATTITPSELVSPFPTPISRKMQWAATREVTRGEDAAYSLMGIFGVNMSIAYGEGAQLAFVRLLKEILSTAKSQVLDMFNWAGGEYRTGVSALLPNSPRAYLQRCTSNELVHRSQASEPLILTHLGLRIPVLLLPGVRASYEQSYSLLGDYYATIDIQPTFPSLNESSSPSTHSYCILDVRTCGMHNERPVFVVLNCEGDDSIVLIPRNCFAILFHETHNEGRVAITPLMLKDRVQTKSPVVFELNNRNRNPQDPRKSYTVMKSQLEQHGMEFRTMYL